MKIILSCLALLTFLSAAHSAFAGGVVQSFVCQPYVSTTVYFEGASDGSTVIVEALGGSTWMSFGGNRLASDGILFRSGIPLVIPVSLINGGVACMAAGADATEARVLTE